MSNKKYYITTTLPYVNADPHIGFAAEIIRADVLARYARLQGKEVFFNTGTDEHGLKIFRKAEEQGKDTQSYVDEYAAKFDNLKTALNLSYDNFIRTTDENHKRLAQEFWKKCEEKGDIYKKNYQIKYCVGCELELTESELVDGKCPHHPNQELELIEEENYFFRWSNYGDKLLEFYEKNPSFVIPNNRFNEIKNFIKNGLQDFSISRLKEKMPWGVPVPGNEDHVMYVWFDALTNYVNCLNWNTSSSTLSKGGGQEGVEDKDRPDLFSDFWGTHEEPNAIQVAGKDNLRQQTAMWQAMLMSADLPPSRQVMIFGFITSEGQKMSKSLGNVVNPIDIVDAYGTDAVRYYLLAALRPYEDSDYSKKRFETKYNADLANGLGNLLSRSITLVNKVREGGAPLPEYKEDKEWEKSAEEMWQEFEKAMEEKMFDTAIAVPISQVSKMDQYLATEKPWQTMKENPEEAASVLCKVIESIRHIAIMLLPFMPQAASEILDRISYPEKNLKSLEEEKVFGLWPSDSKVEKGEPLFKRLDIA